jgi:hypothetical protein
MRLMKSRSRIGTRLPWPYESLALLRCSTITSASPCARSWWTRGGGQRWSPALPGPCACPRAHSASVTGTRGCCAPHRSAGQDVIG